VKPDSEAAAEETCAAGPRCRGRRPTPEMRERILRSADILFGSRAFHRVLTDEVAALAGVGKGSIYRQFGSKEALYAAVVIDGLSRLRDKIQSALSGCDLRVDLTTLATHTIEFFRSRREFFTLLHDPTALPPEETKRYFAERDKLSRMVTRLLSDGVKRGELRADLDTRIAAEALLGMMRAINRYCRDYATPDQAVASIIAIFIDGAAVAENKTATARQEQESRAGKAT
jgi:AcrR family transcriptional regulator